MKKLFNLDFRKYWIIFKRGAKSFLTFIPLLAFIATTIAFYLSEKNYKESVDLQKETKAIELYHDYIIRVESNPIFIDTSYSFVKDNWTDEYKLFAQYVLFISESIYSLREENLSWEIALEHYLIKPHIPFYESHKSVKQAIKPHFKKFYETVVKEFNRNHKKEN